jgi:hypothetical protein
MHYLHHCWVDTWPQGLSGRFCICTACALSFWTHYSDSTPELDHSNVTATTTSSTSTNQPSVAVAYSEAGSTAAASAHDQGHQQANNNDHALVIAVQTYPVHKHLLATGPRGREYFVMFQQSGRFADSQNSTSRSLPTRCLARKHKYPSVTHMYNLFFGGGELGRRVEVVDLFEQFGYSATPDSSHHNGPGERSHRTVGDAIRTLLASAAIGSSLVMA